MNDHEINFQAILLKVYKDSEKTLFQTLVVAGHGATLNDKFSKNIWRSDLTQTINSHRKEELASIEEFLKTCKTLSKSIDGETLKAVTIEALLNAEIDFKALALLDSYSKFNESIYNFLMALKTSYAVYSFNHAKELAVEAMLAKDLTLLSKFTKSVTDIIEHDPEMVYSESLEKKRFSNILYKKTSAQRLLELINTIEVEAIIEYS